MGRGIQAENETIKRNLPQVKSGSVISAVDLIRGIGHYAGLRIIKVKGATGLANTNYEGKTQAALEALRTDDFVFLHIEASDEAGHDGDLDLKLKTIENLDKRVVGPIFKEISTWNDTPVCIAVLPDHPTPVEIRTPDEVQTYNEVSCVSGSYGLLHLNEFIETFIRI